MFVIEGCVLKPCTESLSGDELSCEEKFFLNSGMHPDRKPAITTGEDLAKTTHLEKPDILCTAGAFAASGLLQKILDDTRERYCCTGGETARQLIYELVDDKEKQHFDESLKRGDIW